MFKKIKYSSLNSKQKESYNFHKVAARLAEYGYNSLLLNDDWQGADFIAVHVTDGFLKIQLKGRLTISKKYIGKEIYIAFFHGDDLYVYDHDEVVDFIQRNQKLGSKTISWNQKGNWSWPSPPKWALKALKKYKVSP